MNHAAILIAVLALNGPALAQAPAAPAKPPAAVKAPVAPARPANDVDDDREPSGDEELALAALEGLMAQPGERALPIIKKVLAGQQSTLVKKRALFVLSQIHMPEAQQLLAQTSRSSNEALRPTP